MMPGGGKPLICRQVSGDFFRQMVTGAALVTHTGPIAHGDFARFAGPVIVGATVGGVRIAVVPEELVHENPKVAVREPPRRMSRRK